MSWKNTADMPIVAIARAIAAAIGTPSTPQRVDSEPSATTTTLAVLGCSNSRTTSGLKLVSDRLRPVDRREAVAGLPVAQADEVEAGAVEQAAVIADRELAHPLQDEQLDLGDLRQVDQRRLVGLRSRPAISRSWSAMTGSSSGNRHALDDVLDHGVGGQAVAGRVRAEPDAVAEDVAARGPGCLPDRPRSRRRTSSAHTFASRPQQMIARGEAPRSTLCSTSSDGE